MGLLGFILGIIVSLCTMFFVIRQTCLRLFGYDEERAREAQMNSIFFGVWFAFGGSALGAGIGSGFQPDSMLTGLDLFMPLIGGILGGLSAMAVMGALALLWGCFVWLLIGISDAVSSS
jgi:hypothetical protein